MANWQSRSSSRRAHRTERGRRALLPVVALLAAGCGRADDRAPAGAPPADPPSDVAATLPGAREALCVPALTGSLRARLQGAIDAEIDWGPQTGHCQGDVRPQGGGLRLIYRGSTPDTTSLLIVFGLADLRPGENARNLPVNLTVVREGTGQFFATQGEDKCALDTVAQVPVAGATTQYRLEGRGYCTQPARALVGDGAVLVSRFDVVAIVAADGARRDPGGPVADSQP